MRKSNKPWYCEERCQGSLVSWGEEPSIGILIGWHRVRKPGMPETLSVMMLDVLGPRGLETLYPYAVSQLEDE